MRAPAVSFVHKLLLVIAVGLLACDLALPQALAFAEGEDAPSALLASSLMDGSASVVREDVALAALEDDAAPEPVIGSFTVDGLTFAVTEGSNVQLVGVSPSWQQVTGLQTGEGSSQPSMPASEAEGPDAGSSALLLPGTVAYNGVEYSVSSIGAYAFYLSGVTSVELPASIADVDDCAFRSSDVASVEVADGNLTYSSFDGALYDADQLSLLLIPEGKQGTVLLPKEAESASPSVFSHCPLVTQVSVGEGSAAFASENGLLYDASLTTLLRVPAGATEITIREGCTTIAAGAMEACASLEHINAPATIASISSDVFMSVLTISLPAEMAASNPSSAMQVDAVESSGSNEQVTAIVALSSADMTASKVRAADIEVSSFGESAALWAELGFVESKNMDAEPFAGHDVASSYAAAVPYGYRVDKKYHLANLLEDPMASTGKISEITYGGYNVNGFEHYVDFAYIEPYGYYVTGVVPATSKLYILGVVDSEGRRMRVNGWTHVGQIPFADDSYYEIGYELRGIEYASFDLCFDTNGGSGGPDRLKVAYSQSLPSLESGAVPEKPGYIFKGWYDGKDWLNAKQYYDSSGKAVAGLKWDKNAEATLYAGWEAKTITITWDSRGGTPVDDTVKTYVPGAKVPMPGTKPVKSGYSFIGWFTSIAGGDEIASGTALPTKSTTFYAQWEKTPSHVVSLNTGEESSPSRVVYYWEGRGYTTSMDSETIVEPGSILVMDVPVRNRYRFKGYFSASVDGTQYIDEGGKLTAYAPALQASTIWYAQWERIGTDNGVRVMDSYHLIMIDSLEDHSGRIAETSYQGWNYNGASSSVKIEVSTTYGYCWVFPEIGIVAVGDGDGNRMRVGNSVAVGKVFYNEDEGAFYEQCYEARDISHVSYAMRIDANGGKIGSHNDSATYVVTFGSNQYSSILDPLSREGYVFEGLYTEPLGGNKIYDAQGNSVCDGQYWNNTFQWCYRGDAAFYAHWTPAISADVPIEVTAQVDLLGIEDQVPASGYIESRCGEPLAVKEVSFKALPGAEDLFGEANTASVSLQALALEGDASWDASAPTFSFPLSADATESDASKLAALRMETYEDHIPIGYRFAIPEDVLASIDPTRFEQVTTPVCSVSYTVALA